MATAYRVANWSKNFENNRTKELKRLEWVPVPNDMSDLGYLELIDHPNGAAHLGAWLAILEIASKQTIRGEIPQAGAGTPQALARISRLPESVFAEVLPRLLALAWVEVVTNEPLAKNPQVAAEIPQGDAIIPQVAAEKPALKGMEGNGTEGNLKPSSASGEKRAAAVVASDAWFDSEFWPAWPVARNRKAAKVAARKIKPQDRPKVVAGVKAQASRIAAMERPIHAATWINGARWEDTLEPLFAGQPAVEQWPGQFAGRPHPGLVSKPYVPGAFIR